jgi:hypothetical protein
MSSIHASLMRPASSLLVAVQGEPTGVKYVPDKTPPFDWPGCIVGSERGGIDETPAGDLVKVIRRSISGPTATLVAKGVKGLDREASVLIGETNYSIDLAGSLWGPELVRLEIVRRPIARHQDLEDRSGRR